MVPHHRFWTALPGLVMNGVQFTHHFAVHRQLQFSPGDGAPVTAAGLSDAVPDYGTGDSDSYAGSSSSRKSKSSKKDKHEKEKREAVSQTSSRARLWPRRALRYAALRCLLWYQWRSDSAFVLGACTVSLRQQE
jgi:hypothetical protein